MCPRWQVSFGSVYSYKDYNILLKPPEQPETLYYSYAHGNNSNKAQDTDI